MIGSKSVNIPKHKKTPHPTAGKTTARRDKHTHESDFGKSLRELEARRRSKSEVGKNPAIQAALSTSKPFQAPIDRIVVGPGHRKIDQEAVMTIAASMKEFGQLQPILVREGSRVLTASPKLTLIDGAHRREAAKLLGWTTISVVKFQGDKDAARVYELTQILARAGTTALDHAKSLAELIQVTLGKAKAGELAQPGGKQPGEKGIAKTARVLGFTRDDIRRSSVIASMSDDAMAKAVERGLDNNQSALLKIVKEKDPDEQVALAEQLGVKKKRPKKRADAADKEKDEASYTTLMTAWASSTDCERALRKATQNGFRKFIRKLQSLLKSVTKKANSKPQKRKVW